MPQRVHHQRPCQYVKILFQLPASTVHRTDTPSTEVYSVSTKLCTKVLEQHGEKYDQPAALSEGICAAGKTPAASSGNSTGSAKPSSNTTSSSASPSGSGAAYEGGANSAVGMSMAAIAVGGLAFLAM